MASSVNVAGELRDHYYGTLNLGAYATGGVAVTPEQFGLEANLGALNPHFKALGY